MWKVISVIVLAVLGLVGVKKLQSSAKKGMHIPTPGEERFSNSGDSDKSGHVPPTNTSDFDLSKLTSVFDAFKVDINSYNALYHLLKAIEKKAFLETLNAINKKANTPADLIELANTSLPNEPFNQISFNQGQYGPYVKRDYIVSLCEEKKLSTVSSLDDLVKSLIIANTQSGMKLFNIMYGSRIQSMKDNMNAGKDVSEEFAALKSKFTERIKRYN